MDDRWKGYKGVSNIRVEPVSQQSTIKMVVESGYICGVLSVALSATFAACIFFFRSPFALPGFFPVLKSVLIVTTVVFVWLELFDLTPEVKKFGSPWPVTGAMLALFAPCATLNWPVLDWLLFSLYGGITVAGVAKAVRILSQQPLVYYLTLAFTPILGVGYFALLNAYGPHVLSPEYALVGQVDLDLIFHSALASMIAEHNAISTGLDGMVAIKYHFLSHVWIGKIARWLHVPTIHAYYLVCQIVGVPLYFFALMTACLGMSNFQKAMRFPLFVALVPFAILLLIDIGSGPSYLISESHLLGMTLFLLALPLLVSSVRSGASLRALVILGCFGAPMLLAKISIGCIWFAGLLFAMLRSPRISQFERILFGAATVVCAALLIKYYVFPSGHSFAGMNDPFFFVRNVPKGFAIVFAAILVLWSTVLLGYRSATRQQRSVGELFLLLSAASVIPTVTIGAGAGSSVYYFLDVGGKVAIVFLAGTVLSKFAPSSRPIVPIGILVVAAVAWASDPHKLSAWKMLPQLATALAHATDPAAKQDAAEQATPNPNIRSALNMAAGRIDRTYGAKIASLLAAKVGYGDRRTIVFVPPSNTRFWHLHMRCAGQAFFVPALIAVPMINGVQSARSLCPGLTQASGYGYGYDSYGDDAGPPFLPDDELCRKARKLGFSRVFVLASDIDTRMLSCASLG